MRHIDEMDANRGLFSTRVGYGARTRNKGAVLSSRCVREIRIAHLSRCGPVAVCRCPVAWQM